jgi:hypothetical protein
LIEAAVSAALAASEMRHPKPKRMLEVTSTFAGVKLTPEKVLPLSQVDHRVEKLRRQMPRPLDRPFGSEVYIYRHHQNMIAVRPNVVPG